MHLVTLDLEGVLIPEIWVALADLTEVEELKRTTRDEPDYDALMRYRLAILERENIRLPMVQEAVAGLRPLPGAAEFLGWLRAQTRVILLSDTFHQFAHPLMAQLDYPTLFCHELVIDPDGRIRDYRLRQADQKRRAVLGFQSLGFRVAAAGDSYNDVSMLETAEHAVLFRPPESLAQERPDWPVARDHTELQASLGEFLRGAG